MDSNPIALAVRVLEFKESTFKGKDGNEIAYNSALLRFDGIVYRLTSKVDLSEYLDKDIQVAVEIASGANQTAKLRIVGVA